MVLEVEHPGVGYKFKEYLPPFSTDTYQFSREVLLWPEACLLFRLEIKLTSIGTP
jgi:hypothetical protein